MEIIKRDNSKTKFKKEKIIDAIIKAMNECDKGIDRELAWDIAEEIECEFEESDVLPTVESVSDRVEELLAENGRFDASKRYILYRQERAKIREQGWGMTDLQRDIYEKKYRFENETFEEFLDRVSGGNDKIRKLIANRDFLFGGRILAGRGIDRNVSLANCTTLPPIQDNIESIFDTAKELARMFSYGQGAGIDITNLRPKGAPVNNASKTSTGAVSFMQVYDTVSDVIGAEGRRAALLIAMDANHKDILDFINIKNDINKINNANISVKADDDFMKLDTKKKRDTLNAIARSSWATGEPAILYWGNNERWHLLSEDSEYVIEGVNACVVGDTKILTDKGNLPIKSLVGKEVNVWNGYEFSKVIPKITGENQEILDIRLSNGVEISCTPYHEFILKNGKKIKAKELKIGDKLSKWEYPIIDFNNSSLENKKEMYTKGFFSGDGCYQDNHRTRSTIRLYNEKKKLLPFIDYYNKYETGNNVIVLDLDCDKYNDKLDVPSATYSVKDRLDWLAGLIDSDGTLNGKCGALAISSTELDFLKDVQLLLTTLGCHSSLGLLRESGKRLMPDGKGGEKLYDCKTCYRLNISATNVKKLMTLGLETHRVELKASPNRDASRFIYIENIKKRDTLEKYVYCFNEPKRHTGVFNGVLTGQCSEYPTTGYGTCLLGSINLSNYVLDPYTEKAKVNIEKLAEDTQDIVIGMNEVLDEAIPTHPLKQQREVARNYRQIGIGIMGLGDLFIKLGVRYGSKESLKIVDLIMSTIRDNAFQSSIDLAKKYGSFPKFDYEKMRKSEYFKALPKEIQEQIAVYGIYNSSLLSIAPAGTLSLLCDVSNGLEPLFATSFTRTTKSLGAIDKDYVIYPTVIQELMEHKGITNENELPEYCVTAHDIDPFDRIDLQSTLQHYVDLAISSTINLKEDTTIETIEEIYKYAHKKGLKGISVFRDNCLRVGILNTNKENDRSKNISIQDKIDKLQQQIDEVALHSLSNNPNACPMCGGEMIHSGGCATCQDCGYSPCAV